MTGRVKTAKNSAKVGVFDDSDVKKCEKRGKNAKNRVIATVGKPDPARVQQVWEWLIQAATEHEIKKTIATRWPGQDPQPLIAEAITRLMSEGELNAAAVRGWCFEAYRDLYREFRNMGDLVGALKAVKLIQDMTAKG